MALLTGYRCDSSTLTPELIRTAVIADRKTFVDKFPYQLQAKTEAAFTAFGDNEAGSSTRQEPPQHRRFALGRQGPAWPRACTREATTPPRETRASSSKDGHR